MIHKMSYWNVCVLVLLVSCNQISSIGTNLSQDLSQSSSSISDTKIGFSHREYHIDIGKQYNFSVTQFDSALINFSDTHIKGKAIRLRVSVPNATKEFPVLFAIKQQTSILSWQVPILIFDMYFYFDVSRTLCPSLTQNYILIDVSTMSSSTYTFHIRADFVTLMLDSSNNSAEMIVSPARPSFLEYQFPPNVWSVVVHAIDESKSRVCAVLSVQAAKCPMYDVIDSIELAGYHQTITGRGAITVTREMFHDSFFIAIAVKPTDRDCGLQDELEPARNGSSRFVGPARVKNVLIEVVPSISESQFIGASLSALCFFLIFYIIATVVSLIHWKINLQTQLAVVESNEDRESAETTNILRGRDDSTSSLYGAAGASSDRHSRHSDSNDRQLSRQLSSSSSEISIDEDIDLLHDVLRDRNIIRSKPFISVADLSQKPRKVLTKKYNLYIWNLVSLAIFYVLPVIQLVITYQTVLNKTGNEDICYYNFQCTHRLSFLTAFNNVFSNIGYIMLGLLFIFLVYRRDRLHRKRLLETDPLAEPCGIPQHFGVFYSMGIALAMEGILSGCYHVCPSYNNFQFDTAFMYMIGWLCIIKIYQTRHPDVNAHAHTAYCIIAFIVFIGVIGVTQANSIFWIIFVIFYIICSFLLTVHIYFVGRWHLAFGTCRDCYALICGRNFSFCSKPMYPDRMVLLVLCNAVNWTFATYGVITMPKDFASYLLAIVIINLLMYFAFYIVMKLRCGEKILMQPLFYIIATTVVWSFALYFFMARLTSWQVSPAMSREGNEECQLLSFYDSHDIWHFLSSTSLFLSFMALLTLEDDLIEVPRTKIAVF